MSEKKRKRHSEGASGNAAKRLSVENASDTVKVSLLDKGELWQPVLGIVSALLAKYPKAYESQHHLQVSQYQRILHS